MTSAVPHAKIQELLRHEGFLRKILRGLLAREEDVQDALQQTWLSVLERPGVEAERPRTWLARVARNAALSGLRSRQRRARREAEAARRPEVGTPADSVARMEALQRVVAAILALEEPYRSVVLLCYEQDLDAGAIARRLGRPEATVRSQLSRAHALLRRELDREFGGRERWALLAAPLVARPAAGVVPLAAGIVLALAGGWAAIGWWTGSSRPAKVEGKLAAASAPEPAPSAAPPQATARREPLLPSALPAVTPPAVQPPTSSSFERHLAPAELLDRKHYDDYERATFSFQHALRDDPGLAITRNDWDLCFAGGRFYARTVVDDAGFIADLGELPPDALDGTTLAGRTLDERATVQEGHSYFLWSLDGDTDLACLLHVREHEKGRRCLVDWYATDGTGRAQGSLSEDGAGERLVDLLVRLRREALDRQGVLRAPRVLLQARTGARGNEGRVHMNGERTYIDELAQAPLDLGGEIGMDEPSRAYLEGGWIPDGQLFHVTGVLYSGRATGDSNGRGLFAVVVGGTEIVRAPTGPEPAEGGWSGDIALAPGDESRTYLAIANSSAGEARLSGYFSAATRPGFGRPNTGFFATVAPVPAPGEPIPAPEPLAAPRVVLQARSGAGGGNPNRIDMTGKTSLYVDRVEPGPLDFAQPPDSDDDSLVFFEGGRVPAGQVFVVTRATWWGTSAGDSNGHGELKLVVAGEVLVHEQESEDVHQGVWTGRLLVPPGEETRTYLEIANSSSADVLLTGHFEPAGD